LYVASITEHIDSLQ